MVWTNISLLRKQCNNFVCEISKQLSKNVNVVTTTIFDNFHKSMITAMNSIIQCRIQFNSAIEHYDWMLEVM